MSMKFRVEIDSLPYDSKLHVRLEHGIGRRSFVAFVLSPLEARRLARRLLRAADGITQSGIARKPVTGNASRRLIRLAQKGGA